uniref:Uncharacterized protein n=1 Tax=Timema poppense TaxID=170557 RepID=A0A7R9DQA8_TIMPO|nr:unnamed protein product [Timema poppensis]
MILTTQFWFFYYLIYSLYHHCFQGNFIPNLVSPCDILQAPHDFHFPSLYCIKYPCFCCMCDNGYKVRPVQHFQVTYLLHSSSLTHL